MNLSRSTTQRVVTQVGLNSGCMASVPLWQAGGGRGEFQIALYGEEGWKEDWALRHSEWKW